MFRERSMFNCTKLSEGMKMARPGITKKEVFSAANDLTTKGMAPTIEQIRQILKSGSNSTIAGHLRDWRASQNDSGSLALTEGLPQDLVQVIRGLWERLSIQAGLATREAEERSSQVIVDLEQELQKYKANNQRWQQLFNQWQQEKEMLVRDKLTLEQGNEALQNDNLTLHTKLDVQAEQLREKQVRIEELHRLHSQLQANLEHYRESSREQRLIEQAQFEQQKQELNQEIKILKEQHVVLRDKFNAVQQAHQALLQNHSHLENNHAALRDKLTQQELQIAILEKQKNEHCQASQHWHQQYQEQQNTLKETISQLVDAKTEERSTAKQLSDLQRALKDLHDQAKLLGHEKWTIIQEKARLEGQLKQMEKIVNA